jgi:plasmid stabilization system protein ParE
LRRLIGTFVQFPRSGSPRSVFGAGVRIGVMAPYVVFYEFQEDKDTVTLLRILHSKRNITQELLRR